jgi:hypothetical protein
MLISPRLAFPRNMLPSALKPRQLRIGSAGTIVTSPFSSTDTTYRLAPCPLIRLRSDFNWPRSTTIAWVSVRVSISKPSWTLLSKNASRAFFLPPVGSISPATQPPFEAENPNGRDLHRTLRRSNSSMPRYGSRSARTQWSSTESPRSSGGFHRSRRPAARLRRPHSSSVRGRSATA